eukprot:scaffold2778_cov254-Pinguiococcus_pyrenoidosus.AAC.2
MQIADTTSLDAGNLPFQAARRSNVIPSPYWPSPCLFEISFTMYNMIRLSWVIVICSWESWPINALELILLDLEARLFAWVHEAGVLTFQSLQGNFMAGCNDAECLSMVLSFCSSSRSLSTFRTSPPPPLCVAGASHDSPRSSTDPSTWRHRESQ